MDYKSFMDEIRVRVEKSMGVGYDVKVRHIVKNNGVGLMGLVIFEKGRREISPTIYLEPFYRKYLEEFTISEIVDEIIAIYIEAMARGDMEFPDTGFEAAKDVLTYRLVGYSKNKDVLARVPHIRFLDLAITFHYIYSNTPDGVRSFQVTNEIMEQWNITVKELFQISNRNTQKLFPVVLRAMDDVMTDYIYGGHRTKEVDGELSSAEIVYEWLQTNKSIDNIENDFIIISNQSGINGATSMIYPEVISTIAREWESDIYLFPSSIHEVIVTRYTEDFSDSILNKLVREVNMLELPYEDILSDHVYLYRRKTNSFER